MAAAPRKPNTISKQPPAPQATTIFMPRGIAPMAAFFVAMPSLMILAIILAVTRNSFPVPLLGLLALVACSCAYWIKIALPQVGDLTLELASDALLVKRMFGTSTYPWSDIEAAKLFDPGSTLADSGRNEEGRIGIGLYLKSTAKTRKPEAPPDAVIVTGTADNAEAIIKACERITSYQRRGPGGSTGGIGFNRNPKGFRKQIKPSPATA